MMGTRSWKIVRWLAPVLVLAAAAAARAEAPPSGRSAGPVLHDEATRARALEALRAGDLEKALSLYCAMLRPPARGELWTVSVVLHCDASGLMATVEQVQRPAPVFVQERDFQGRRCYRVCAGLTTDRGQASRWVALLPDAMRAQGPFPVRVALPCDGPAGGEVVAPPAPQPQPAPEPKTTPGPRPGREFLGPPVKVPPETPAKEPPGPSPPAPPAAAPAPASSAPPSAASAASQAEVWFRKGLEAHQQGRRLDAYECYDRALALEPERPETLNNLGVLYLEERQYEKARPLFEKAVRLSPAYAAAHLNLAGALWGLKRFDDAIQEAREATVLDSSDVNAYLTLASFFLARDRKPEAAQAAKHALALDPKSERAQVFLQAAQAPREAPQNKR